MKKLINDLSCEVAYLLDNPTNGSVYMVEEEVIETIQDLVTKLEKEIKRESNLIQKTKTENIKVI